MNYCEAIEYIMSRRKFSKSSSLDRIKKLLEHLGNPHKQLRFIHVAGTNGKGSVSTALAQVLSESGYKTGLFTSPYIIKFNERIMVDGAFIPDSQVAEIVSLIREKIPLVEKDGLYPTVFEVTTALGLVYFARAGCDAVVLEAGIGGERDSTNIIENKLLSVIMSVSLDHTDMLGETTAEIAREKCGIIPDRGTVVSYPFESGELGFIPQDREAAKVIKEECEKRGAQLFLPDAEKVTVLAESIKGSRITYGKMQIEINLCGRHQIANMLTVIECARALRRNGLKISDEAIIKGIAGFRIAGRTEAFGDAPLIILDGGHNEGCMRALKKTAEEYLKNKEITLLCSFMKDKDYEKSLSHIMPLCRNAVFTRTDPIRGESEKLLCEVGSKFCKDVFFEENPDKAFDLALGKAENNVLIVCGSFYLVSDVRKKLSKTEKEL